MCEQKKDEETKGLKQREETVDKNSAGVQATCTHTTGCSLVHPHQITCSMTVHDMSLFIYYLAIELVEKNGGGGARRHF